MPNADEFALIDIIKSVLPKTSERTELGIGDDAAVLRPTALTISTAGAPLLAKKQLLCSDCMVEGIHFDLALTSPKDLGYKAVAAALSDIAAMNGQPVAVTISIALPKRESLNVEKFLRQFYEGVARLQHDLEPVIFDVVGGDLSASPQTIFIDVAVIGESTEPILRSGAKAGDTLAVSGFPGTSAAGLYGLQNWKTVKRMSGALTKAHTLPFPRFDLCVFLDSQSCHALIDISDGLASEAHHLAKSSGVHIEINEESIPRHPAAVALAELADPAAKEAALKEWALYGGEDYELLAAFAPQIELPPGFTKIGRVLEANPREPAVTLVTSSGAREPLSPRGYNHFA